MHRDEIKILIDKTEEDLKLSLFYHLKLLGVRLMEKVAFSKPSESISLKDEVFDDIISEMSRIKLVANNVPRMRCEVEKGNNLPDEDYFEDQFYKNQKIIKDYTEENINKKLEEFLDKAKEQYEKIEKGEL